MSSEPSVMRDVDQVLSGEVAYDAVDVEVQRRVRDAWDRRIAERLGALDFAAEFRARGRRWSECDDDGNVVICR